MARLRARGLPLLLLATLTLSLALPSLAQSPYRCGNGTAYPNGKSWEDATDPANNYLDRFNTESGQVVRYRGYEQCYGRSRFDNCFDQTEEDARLRPERVAMCGTGKGGGARWEMKKGDTSPPICIVFGGGNRLYKLNFFPKVDQFALLQVQNSFNSTEFGHLGTAFHVEVDGNYLSPRKRRYGYVTDNECVANATHPTQPCVYMGGSQCTVVPFHTIVIKVNQGLVTGVEFDDDCSLCRADMCVDGNCAQKIHTCRNATELAVANPTADATARTTDCDFKLYVSWSGTDKDGVYLSSAGKRLSQFRRWSLNAVYNQATNFDLGSLPIAPPDTEGIV